jgi:hypothetical protein
MEKREKKSGDGKSKIREEEGEEKDAILVPSLSS